MVVLDLEGSVVEGIEAVFRYPNAPGAVPAVSRSGRYCPYPFHLGNHLGASPQAHSCLGTTHADYFYGEVPCTRPLSKEEVAEDYELNTGRVIGKCSRKNYKHVPGVLVAEHAPFTWGKDPLRLCTTVWFWNSLP